MSPTDWYAPNQQAVRPDASGPGVEQTAQSGSVERSLAQPPATPPAGREHRERRHDE